MRMTTRSLLLGPALLCGFFAVSAPTFAQVGVGVVVSVAPPEIPLYDQPACPGDGYIWTPGYWDWDGEEYYWVPGTWVEPPEVGFLWTPGWWGWRDNGFFFTAGYWGPVVGFYGGINYGFGYFGNGFVGGRWDGGHFFYNRAVWNVNAGVVHNVYENRVTVNAIRTSYNGGRGGVVARATAEQERAASERHVGAVAAQTRNVEAARADRNFRYSVNHGAPAVAATARAGEFRGEGVAGAHNAARAENNPARNEPTPRAENNATRSESNAARSENNARGNYVHPNDLPAAERMAKPNTGDAKRDQKYQQQQDKLASQQAKDRQNLQARQEKEHQQAQKQQSNEASHQQMEQRHQQQTQQLQQRHAQQTQQLQSRQSAPAAGAKKK